MTCCWAHHTFPSGHRRILGAVRSQTHWRSTVRIRKMEKTLTNLRMFLPLHSHSLITHYFHSVARCCRDIPGALLPAWVLVRPVWTAHHSLCTAQLMLTTSLRRREIIRQRHQGRSHTGTALLKHPTCSFLSTKTLSMAELGKASVTGKSLSELLHNSGGFVPRKACMFGIPCCSQTSWLR